jgi:hypothetical protein
MVTKAMRHPLPSINQLDQEDLPFLGFTTSNGEFFLHIMKNESAFISCYKQVYCLNAMEYQ